MSVTGQLKHRAFLSYAHADVRWGKRLHSQLESFRIDKDLAGRETSRGLVPKTLSPIFRDREDFSGGHSLTDATIAALDQSSALIVLCSAIAATRPAVNEEVRLFRHHHPDRPVIPVILDGTYPENFPPALRFEIASDGIVTDRPITILGPDLRDTGDGKSLGLAKIVAGLIGVGTDEIVKRAERNQRRRLRNWVIGLSGIALALAGLTVWAEINRRIAEVQRREAVAQTERALIRESRYLTNLADERLERKQPSTALLLALEALPDSAANNNRPHVPEAQKPLNAALRAHLEVGHLGGHAATVWDIAHSPDGRWWATASEDKTARIWDAVSNKEAFTLEGHRARVRAAQFSPNSLLLATASEDGTVHLWKVASGELVAVLDGEPGDVSAAFSADGSRVVALGRHGIARVFETATGTLVSTFAKHGEWVTAGAFSPDGRTVVSSGLDRRTYLWSADEGTDLGMLQEHDRPPIWVTYTRDGSKLIVATDKNITVWLVASKQRLRTFGHHSDIITSVSLNPSEELLLTTSRDRTAKLWNVHDGALVNEFAGHENEVDHGAFSREGTFVATTSKDGTARIWGIHEENAVLTLYGHQGSVHRVSWAANGRTIATAAIDEASVRVWSTRPESTDTVIDSKDSIVFHARLSPDGKKAVTLGYKQTVRVWDVLKAAELFSLTKRDVVGYPQFVGDENRLLTFHEGGIARVWDLDKNDDKPIAEFRDVLGSTNQLSEAQDIVTRVSSETLQVTNLGAMTSATLKIAKDPVLTTISQQDPKRLFVIWEDGHAEVHDVAEQRVIAALDGKLSGHFKDVVFSPNGRRVLTREGPGASEVLRLTLDPLADKKLDLWRIWNADSGKELARINVPNNSKISTHTFNHDGSRVTALWSEDKTAAGVWNTETGRLEHKLEDAGKQFAAWPEFSPAGDLIAAPLRDRTVRVWQAQGGKIVTTLTGHTNSNIYRAAWNAQGSHLITAAADGTARIWRTYEDRDALVGLAKRRAPRCLTQEERMRYNLAPEPPIWCITGPGNESQIDKARWQGVWPYSLEEWRQWLEERKIGDKEAPLPGAPERQRWSEAKGLGRAWRANEGFDLAIAHRLRGLALTQSGDLDLAIGAFDDALRLEPSYVAAYVGRAQAWQGKQDLVRATADFGQAIRLAPKNAATLRMRGEARAQQKELQLALSDLDAAIELDRADMRSFESRCGVLLQLGQLDRAMDDINKAIALDPNSPALFVTRANIFGRLLHLNRAIADYSTALRLDPRLASAHGGRAYTLFYKGDFVGAAAGFSRALAFSSDRYWLLWRYLSRTRTSEGAAEELASGAAKLEGDTWPQRVIDFYLGKQEIESVVSGASNPEERCEAQYYVGQWHLLRGDRAKAEEGLRAAEATCPMDYTEHAGAYWELKRKQSNGAYDRDTESILTPQLEDWMDKQQR